MNVKIRNKFIEIKYIVSNGLVIFITNYKFCLQSLSPKLIPSRFPVL